NAIFESKSDGIRPRPAPLEGRQIMPLYMRIENPLRVRDLDTFSFLTLGPELERLGLVEDGRAWSDEVYNEGVRRTMERWAREYPGARTKGDLEAAGLSLDDQLAELQDAANEVAIERLEAMGYDGLVYENRFEGGGDSWVAFRPEQIKSAIGNRGTFDPTDPSIIRESAPLYGGDVIRQVGEARPTYAADITQTPEFRRWFGNSKVVDDRGRPLVVYHGTQGDFDAFDPGRVGSFTRAIDTRQGTAFFFTDLPSFASEFAFAGSVMPVYLSLQNPLVVRGHPYNIADIARVIREARAKGHDGVIYRPERAADQLIPTGNIFIAFRPEQIKSAIGNRGTFDPTDPKIGRASAPLYGGDVIREHGAFTNPAPVDWNQPDNYYGVWTADRVRLFTGAGPDAPVYRAIIPADELTPSLVEAEDAVAIRGGTEAI